MDLAVMRGRPFRPATLSSLLSLVCDVPECKGAIGLYRRSEDGAMPNRAEHKAKNRGCSLGDCFDGVKRPSPKPIEPEEESIGE